MGVTNESKVLNSGVVSSVPLCSSLTTCLLVAVCKHRTLSPRSGHLTLEQRTDQNSRTWILITITATVNEWRVSDTKSECWNKSEGESWIYPVFIPHDLFRFKVCWFCNLICIYWSSLQCSVRSLAPLDCTKRQSAAYTQVLLCPQQYPRLWAPQMETKSSQLPRLRQASNTIKWSPGTAADQRPYT